MNLPVDLLYTLQLNFVTSLFCKLREILLFQLPSSPNQGQVGDPEILIRWS